MQPRMALNLLCNVMEYYVTHCNYVTADFKLLILVPPPLRDEVTGVCSMTGLYGAVAQTQDFMHVRQKTGCAC